MMPSPTSGKDRVVREPPTRKSQARVISQPPPNAKPPMAAMVGVGMDSRMLLISMARPQNSRAYRGVASAISFTSAPAAKARSEPVMMSTRTEGSACTSFRAAMMSWLISLFRAFRALGRLSWMVAMPSSTL